jgi:hypothetical protein
LCDGDECGQNRRFHAGIGREQAGLGDLLGLIRIDDVSETADGVRAGGAAALAVAGGEQGRGEDQVAVGRAKTGAALEFGTSALD